MEFQFDNLKGKFLSLPPVLQEAISSVDVADKIYLIGQENGLRIDEMGTIAREAGLVMLGITHPESFVAKIKKELPQIPTDKIEKIAAEINEQIFKEIRSALVEVHEKKELAPTPTPATSPITPAPITQPTPVIPPTNTVAQTKLEQTFRVPPQTATVALNQTPVAPKPIQRREVDPYREPIA